MRLNQIYKILEENKGELTTEKKKVDGTNQDRYQLNNLRVALPALRTLGDLNVFESINDFMEKYPDFYTWNQGIYTDTHSITTSIERDLIAISNEVNSVYRVLETFIPKETGYIISVKLPEYESLNDLPKFYKELDTMLSPLTKYFGEDNLSIYSFENGSKWNDFLVKNKETIAVVLLILTSGSSFYSDITEIQKNRLEMKRSYLSIHEKDLPNEIDAIFEKQTEEKYHEYTTMFIQSLEEKKINVDARGNEESEINNIVSFSYRSYHKLLDDGTEFYIEVNDDEQHMDELGINELIKELETSQNILIETRKIESIRQNDTLCLEVPNEEKDEGVLDNNEN